MMLAAWRRLTTAVLRVDSRTDPRKAAWTLLTKSIDGRGQVESIAIKSHSLKALSEKGQALFDARDIKAILASTVDATSGREVMRQTSPSLVGLVNSLTRNSQACVDPGTSRPMLLSRTELILRGQADRANQKRFFATLGGYPPNEGFDGEPVDETLAVGDKISRYGGFFDKGLFKDHGMYVAPVDVPFPMRSLPEDALKKPLTVYKIEKPIRVKKGPAAPWFDQPGGGMQYKLPMTIQQCVEQGYLSIESQTLAT